MQMIIDNQIIIDDYYDYYYWWLLLLLMIIIIIIIDDYYYYYYWWLQMIIDIAGARHTIFTFWCGMHEFTRQYDLQKKVIKLAYKNLGISY